MEKLNIHWKKVGKADGYEHYYLEFSWDGGELVGTASWDGSQRNGRGLYVGSLEGVKGKNFYAQTPEGIAWKFQRKLELLTN